MKTRQLNTLQLAVLVTGLLLTAPWAAGESPTKEYQVKLAFLFKFSQYVQTHGTVAPGEIRIGVLGSNPFHDALGKLEGRMSGDKTCRIRHFPDVDAYRDTDILFITKEVDAEELERISRSTSGKSVLVVGESFNVLRSGGVMSFRIGRQGNVEIYLNSREKTKRRLTIDARLQNICRKWTPGET